MDDLKNSLGSKYLQETKFDRHTLWSSARLDIESGQPYKSYFEAEKVALSTDWDKDKSLREVLQTRRSVRHYARGGLDAKGLSLLLWASQGITGKAGNFLFRTAPSAGALYPVETYLSVQNVEGIDAGLYHYHPAEFCLEKMSSVSAARDVAHAALGQSFLANAAVVFIWSAILRRNFSKYGHRGLRYVFMDAGHICQNLLLAVESLGLGACPVAAFYDDELNGLLGLDGVEESVIYLASIGKKA
jgi:SagB-type dehydrogenase family enzyme